MDTGEGRKIGSGGLLYRYRKLAATNPFSSLRPKEQPEKINPNRFTT
jgi:hypothetical protein